jgi:hypothetical protein
MARILILSPCDTTNLNHGGKVDLLGIMNFLKELGHDTFLIAVDRSNQVHSEGISAKRSGYFQYLLSFSKFPYLAYSRRINKAQQNAIREFKPEVLLLMTDFMLPAYLQLRDLRFRKVILRRANNEYLYLRSLLSIRNPILSLYRTLELLKMGNLQKAIMNQQIDLTLDIATTDLPAPSKIIVTGPLNSKQARQDAITSIDFYDFGYIGNLSLPNATHGVEWFIDLVVPRIQRIRPDARILVAGKSPSKALIKKCENYGVSIIANPDQVTDLYSKLKIFVNPVFKGSGVNMKLMTPIEQETPIVTTSFGSRGYPEIDEIYGVGDTVETFTNKCLETILNYEEYRIHARQVLDSHDNRVRRVHDLVKSEINLENL